MTDDLFKMMEREDDEGRCETCGTLLFSVTRPINDELEYVTLMCNNETCKLYHITVVQFKRSIV